MYDYLILAEKPSAAKHFKTALGGQTGTFNGHTYKIVNALGHLYELDEPEKMVAPELAEKYGSWDISNMPWDHHDFKWHRVPSKRRNPRTHKIETTKKTIDGIKSASKDCKAIVIATDTDPSGEGELLGWEIVKGIGWKKTVLRVHFDDESKPSLQRAMKKLDDITDMNKDGDYVKSNARSRWDFLSMQLTRIATQAAREAGYNVSVVRQGRLKSVMVSHVYEQLQAIKNYVKKPYFEVKFDDGNKHIFARKLTDEEAETARFASKADAQKNLQNYSDSAIAGVKKTRRKTAPGALLSLSGLASILGRDGFSSKEILATYQKMYEAGIVSYPRTEDKNITPEQFNELLPLVDKIAGVVDVDTKLLTHRTPRSTHVKNKGSHGANRPGLKVPSSLASLKVYGASAPDIYKTLAKNFLAMFGEDYVYDAVTAHLEKYPKFVTHFSIPVALNFKLIFNDSQLKDEDESDDSSKKLNATASPYVYEGANKKPAKPTTAWLYRYLTKYGVGTGATQVSTLSDITNGSKALLTEKRGVLGITDLGEVAAVMCKDTWIASVKVTKQLFDAMDLAGKFKLTPDKILDTATQVVKHDLPIFQKNASTLTTVLGKPKAKFKPFVKKAKVEGIFEPKGISVSFNRKWSSHEFTSAEIKSLLAGKKIVFDFQTASGRIRKATGKLERQTYKGHEFWGFKSE